jgi:hypothetical protein
MRRLKAAHLWFAAVLCVLVVIAFAAVPKRAQSATSPWSWLGGPHTVSNSPVPLPSISPTATPGPLTIGTSSINFSGPTAAPTTVAFTDPNNTTGLSANPVPAGIAAANVIGLTSGTMGLSPIAPGSTNVTLSDGTRSRSVLVTVAATPTPGPLSFSATTVAFTGPAAAPTTVAFTDPGNTVALSASPLPAGITTATVSGLAAGTINLTPRSAGSSSVTVSDGTRSGTIAVTVAATPGPLTLGVSTLTFPNPAATATTVAFSDPSNASTVSASPNPAGIANASVTGTSTGTVAVTPVTAGTTAITVTDGTRSAILNVAISAPTPTPGPLTVGTASISFSGPTAPPTTVPFADPGNTVTITTSPLPVGIASAAAAGLSAGTISLSPVAPGSTNVTVSDGTRSTAISVTVASTPTPGPLTMGLTSISFSGPTAPPTTVPFTDPGNGVTLTANPIPAGIANATITGLAAGTLMLSPVAPGSTSVTVSDGTRTANVAVTVAATPGPLTLGTNTIAFANPSASATSVAFTDPNNTVAITAAAAPGGITTVSATGTATGTVSLAPAGSGSANVTVSDGTRTGNIAVSVGTPAPAITPTPVAGAPLIVDSAQAVVVTSTPLSVTLPNGPPSAGDMLVACAVGSYASTITPPAGWNTLFAASTSYATAIFWHLAGVGESATTTWLDSRPVLDVAIDRISNALGTAPTYTQTANAAASITTAVGLPTGVNSLPIACFNGSNGASYSIDPGWQQDAAQAGTFPQILEHRYTTSAADSSGISVSSNDGTFTAGTTINNAYLILVAQATPPPTPGPLTLSPTSLTFANPTAAAQTITITDPLNTGTFTGVLAPAGFASAVMSGSTGSGSAVITPISAGSTTITISDGTRSTSAPIVVTAAGPTPIPSPAIIDSVSGASISGAALVMPWPLGTPNPGDMLVACGIGSYGSTITPPTNWNTLVNTNATYATGLFWRIAGVGETAAPSWQDSASVLVVSMARVQNAAPVAPPFSAANNTAASITTANLVPTVLSSLPLECTAGNYGTSYGIGSGWSLITQYSGQFATMMQQRNTYTTSADNSGFTVTVPDTGFLSGSSNTNAYALLLAPGTPAPAATSIAVIQESTSFNETLPLSALTSSGGDWSYFGYLGSSASKFDNKVGAGNTLSTLSASGGSLGVGGSTANGTSVPIVSWVSGDGTPDAANSGAALYEVSQTGSTGTGLSFTSTGTASSSTTKTVFVLAGSYCSAVSLTVSSSDNSFAPVSNAAFIDTVGGPGAHVMYGVQFSTKSPSTVVTFKLTNINATTACGTPGTFGIHAAYMQAGAQSIPTPTPQVIVAAPTSVTFANPTAANQTVTVTEAGFSGNFTATSGSPSTASDTISNASGTGTITIVPHAGGSTNITVSDGTQTLLVPVTVTPVAPIVLSPTSLTFASSTAANQSVAVSESGFGGTFTATSSNTVVASVSAVTGGSMTINPNSAGSAIITVLDGTGKSATLPVTIAATGSATITSSATFAQTVSWSSLFPGAANDWETFGENAGAVAIPGMNSSTSGTGLSTYTVVGASAFGGQVDSLTVPGLNITWTGGTPNATDSSILSEVKVSGTGNGYQFSLPATTTAAKVNSVHVIATSYCSIITATIQTTDGSFAPISQSATNATATVANEYFDFQYSTGTASATVTIAVTVTNQSQCSSIVGNVGLRAIGYAPNTSLPIPPTQTPPPSNGTYPSAVVASKFVNGLAINKVIPYAQVANNIKTFDSNARTIYSCWGYGNQSMSSGQTTLCTGGSTSQQGLGNWGSDGSLNVTYNFRGSGLVFTQGTALGQICWPFNGTVSATSQAGCTHSHYYRLASVAPGNGNGNCLEYCGNSLDIDNIIIPDGWSPQGSYNTGCDCHFSVTEPIGWTPNSIGSETWPVLASPYQYIIEFENLATCSANTTQSCRQGFAGTATSPGSGATNLYTSNAGFMSSGGSGWTGNSSQTDANGIRTSDGFSGAQGNQPTPNPWSNPGGAVHGAWAAPAFSITANDIEGGGIFHEMNIGAICIANATGNSTTDVWPGFGTGGGGSTDTPCNATGGFYTGSGSKTTVGAANGWTYDGHVVLRPGNQTCVTMATCHAAICADSGGIAIPSPVAKSTTVPCASGDAVTYGFNTRLQVMVAYAEADYGSVLTDTAGYDGAPTFIHLTDDGNPMWQTVGVDFGLATLTGPGGQPGYKANLAVPFGYYITHAHQINACIIPGAPNYSATRTGTCPDGS